jgi:hypothetical protein
MPKVLGLALLALVLVASLLAAAPPAPAAAAQPAVAANAPATAVAASCAAVPQLPDFLVTPRLDVISCPQTPPGCCAFRCNGSCCICVKVGAGCQL